MERIDDFVLIQSLGSLGWGENYLAVEAPQGKAQRIVWLVRLETDLPLASPRFRQRLADLIGLSKGHVSDPGIYLPDRAELEKPAPYFIFRPIQGRSLAEVLATAREQFLPLTVNLALLIANHVHAALETLHELVIENEPVFHGCVTPENVFISYEGEVHILCGAICPALVQVAPLPEALRKRLHAYLAPEQMQGLPGSRRSDVFHSALLTISMLTNQPLEKPIEDPAAYLVKAKWYREENEQESLPRELQLHFLKALEQDPVKRTRDIPSFRKPLDELAFSGAYQATLFNLAYYMNNLFRDHIEAERKLIDRLLKEDYSPLFERVSREPEFTEIELEEALPGTSSVTEDIVELEASDEATRETAGAPRIDETLYPQVAVAPTARKWTPLLAGLIGLGILGAGVGIWFLKFRPHPSSSQTETPPPAASQQTVAESRVDEKIRFLEETIQRQQQFIEKLSAQLEQAQQTEGEPSDTQQSSIITELQRQIRELRAEQARLLSELEQQQAQRSSAPPSAAGSTQEPAPAPAEEKPTPAAPQPEVKPVGKAETPPLPTAKAQPQPLEGETAAPTATPTPQEEATPPVPPAAAATKPSPPTPPPKPVETPVMPPQPILERLTDQHKLQEIRPCKFIYPRILRSQRFEGLVIYQAWIDSTGYPRAVKILRSDHPALERAVKNGVKKTCRFTPPTYKGRPVEALIVRTVRFRPTEE